MGKKQCPRNENRMLKQKAHSKAARQNALRWLAQRFPSAFDNKECIAPLNIGIMKDIISYADEAKAAGISIAKLRQAVAAHTRRLDYLTALKAQEMRINLAGVQTIRVSPEEAAAAAQKIKKRIEKTIKNAKKTNTFRPVHTYPKGQAPNQQTKTGLPPHQYPDSAYHMQNTHSSPQKPTPSITIKPSRQYDPKAVARLKEKLGLARKEEHSEATLNENK